MANLWYRKTQKLRTISSNTEIGKKRWKEKLDFMNPAQKESQYTISN